MDDLLAVTGTGLVHLSSRDGEATVRVLREDADLRAVALDPNDPRCVASGSRGEGVHVSRDGGETWHAAAPVHGDVFSLAISAADGALYVGTEPSRIFRSRDRGTTWTELEALQEIPSRETWSFPPRPWTSHVRWIAPHPSDADHVLVGIELGGVMRTTDGGASFADHPPGAVKDVHALAWHPRDHDRAYEAGGGGAAWSVNRGATWRRAAPGPDGTYCWGLAVDPDDPGTWYVSAAASASRAHRAERSDAAVFRTRAEGPWVRIGPGLPEPLDAFPYALAATAGSVWVGLADGRIYRSHDQGERFERLAVSAEGAGHLHDLRHLVARPQ